jgi:hypothetical protein
MRILTGSVRNSVLREQGYLHEASLRKLPCHIVVLRSRAYYIW